MIVFAGSMIPDWVEETVTPAFALPKPGMEAVTVAEPAATPVTGTVALAMFPAKLTIKGAVATPVLLEDTVADSPAEGAGADRFRVRFCVDPTLTVILPGENDPVPAAAAVTSASAWPAAYPEADAVIAAEPAPTPVTCGWEAGEVAPAAMKTAAVTAAFEVSPLTRLTVAPPEGAGADNVTGSATDWPTPTVTLAGSPMNAACVTVTLALAEV